VFLETLLHVEWFMSASLYALQYKSWNMNCGTWLSASVVRFAKDDIICLWQYTSSEVLQELCAFKKERDIYIYIHTHTHVCVCVFVRETDSLLFMFFTILILLWLWKVLYVIWMNVRRWYVGLTSIAERKHFEIWFVLSFLFVGLW